MTDHEFIARLLARHFRTETTTTEEQQLWEWINAAKENREIFYRFSDTKWTMNELRDYDDIDREAGRFKTWKKIIDGVAGSAY